MDVNHDLSCSELSRLDGSIELVTRPADSIQFYLFNLFAEYIVPRGGRIWTNSLLHLLQLLDVSEQGARTTLSRMKQQGWFITHREGRQSRYEISERGRAILAEGDQRIFEAPYTNWDGAWHLVVYSLPESQRRLRNEFRKKLNWLGYGNLAPGTWVSPHNRNQELQAVLTSLNIEDSVTLFSATTLSDSDIVARCWDTGALEAAYRDFIERYEHCFRTDQRVLQDSNRTLAPEACFVRRFRLTYDFQRFPLQDPNLPLALLPENWAGCTARELFCSYRDLLGARISEWMDEIVGGTD